MLSWIINAIENSSEMEQVPLPCIAESKLTFNVIHFCYLKFLLFVLMGAWMDTSTYGDWVTLIIAGIVGYLMKRGGWPRPPIILAFILGAIMENSFLITIVSASPLTGCTTRKDLN